MKVNKPEHKTATGLAQDDSPQTPSSMDAEESSFVRRMLMMVATVSAVVLLLVLLWYAIDVLLLVFAGILLAVLLDGLSERLSQHTPLMRGWSLTIIMLAIVTSVGLSTWLLAPGLAEQIDQLRQSLPSAVQQLQQRLEEYGWIQTLISQTPDAEALLQNQADIVSQASGVFSTTLGALFNFFIILFVALYLAADPGLYTRGVIWLIPEHHVPRARQVLNTLGTTLWWWLLGRIFSMVVVGVLTALGLWLLDVPLALTLGLLAALLDFIPNIGPIIAAIPGVLLGFLEGPTQALYVALLYLAIQQIESYLVTPLVQQQTVKLPPVVTITSQVLLGVTLGGLGLILASPIAAVVMVLVKMVYVEDVLGKSSA